MLNNPSMLKHQKIHEQRLNYVLVPPFQEGILNWKLLR
ncbi:hypothetical protein SLEP1_g32591 [Rubroshorea leprosula]|uniref:Uncharacterized protein n=1 Tax=Rubroshorea leprosula TaxID=152421 RepID=A0AAV5KDZ1_9ROSI|nr:hypothetical protein SLEP1_g32591 [Rubroshorea leprosula]